MSERGEKEKWEAGWPCRDDCRLARPLGYPGWLWCAAPGKYDRLWREGRHCVQYESSGLDGVAEAGRAARADGCVEGGA